jgi:hypothetical protein
MNLQKKAFDMFRDWTKKAKSYHPELELEILDEGRLVENLRETLRCAYESLCEDSKVEQRKVPGFDVGYLMGFITGYLNSRWYYEYILKQTSLYKEILLLRILKAHFEAEVINAAQVEEQFEEALNQNCNLAKIESKVELEKDAEEYKVGERLDDNVLNTLQNQISRLIEKMNEVQKADYLENGKGYFTEEELKGFLEKQMLPQT